MIAPILGLWQQQIVLRPVQLLMQVSWVGPAIGWQEESQEAEDEEAEDEDDEAKPHQAHT